MFTNSIFSACIPALIEAAEHHPEVAEFLHTYSAGRRQSLVHTIQRGIDTGELPEHLDAELAALALSGAIIYRRTMTPVPLTVDEGQRLVDMTLGASGRSANKQAKPAHTGIRPAIHLANSGPVQ